MALARGVGRSDPNALRDLPSISGVYMRQLLAIGQRWGATPGELTHNLGLTRAQLERSEARVSPRQMGRVAQRIGRLTGREDIGLAFGVAFRPQDFGLLGHALMSSATLGEAMSILYQHRDMVIQDFDRDIDITPGWVKLTFIAKYDLGATRRAFFEALLVVLYRFSVFLTARTLSDWEISVDWPQPPYFGQYRDELCLWQFDQPAVEVRIPRACMDMPLFMADELALQRALEGVSFEQSRRFRVDSDNVVAQVKALLRPGRQGFPSSQAVAGSLFISERTLKRRLQEAGTGYQDLLDDARRTLAISMMVEKAWPLHQVSHVLGFAEPAAFTRAFRRWTGVSPSQYLRAHQEGSD